MSNPIEDLLKSFQAHYSTEDRPMRYTKVQWNEMARKYGWIRDGYASVLYDEVVTRHPMSLRSLPDMAVISEAMRSLDRPEIYNEPATVPQLTDDAGFTDEELEENFARLREIVGLAASARRMR